MKCVLPFPWIDSPQVLSASTQPRVRIPPSNASRSHRVRAHLPLPAHPRRSTRDLKAPFKIHFPTGADSPTAVMYWGTFLLNKTTIKPHWCRRPLKCYPPLSPPPKKRLVPAGCRRQSAVVMSEQRGGQRRAVGDRERERERRRATWA